MAMNLVPMGFNLDGKFTPTGIDVTTGYQCR
jgi:hypothetical protein